MASRVVFSYILVLYFMNFGERANCNENEGGSPSRITRLLFPNRHLSDKVPVAEENRLAELIKNQQRKPSEKSDLENLLRGKGNCDAKVRAVDDFKIAYENGGPSRLEEWVLTTLGEELLACGYLLRHYTTNAKWCYDEAIKINPNNAKSFAKRALCHLLYSIYSEENAISDLKTAIKLNPKLEENYLSLQEIIYEIGEDNDSLQDLLTILNDTHLWSLCKKLKKNSKFKKAIYCFTEAIERNPRNEELSKLYWDRASCYYRIDQLEMAIVDYKNRTQLDIHNVEEYWYPLVVLLLDNKKFNQFEKEINVLNCQKLEKLANILMTPGKYPYAILVISEMIKKDSSNARYYKLRSDCYLKIEKKDESLSDLKVWVTRNPDKEKDRLEFKMNLIKNPKTKELVKMGLEFIPKEKFRSSVNLFDGALANDPDCEICYEKRAYCYWKLGNYENAIRDFEKAVELAKWDLICQIDLCEVLVDGKQYEKAQRILEQINVELNESTSPITVKRIKNIQAKIK